MIAKIKGFPTISEFVQKGGTSILWRGRLSGERWVTHNTMTFLNAKKGRGQCSKAEMMGEGKDCRRKVQE